MKAAEWPVPSNTSESLLTRHDDLATIEEEGTASTACLHLLSLAASLPGEWLWVRLWSPTQCPICPIELTQQNWVFSVRWELEGSKEMNILI